MPKTTLQLINSTLALIGEQALLSSTGTLGSLARDALNTAIVNVAQETRANIFETTIQVNATASDYLTPVTTLPSTVIQVYTVSLRQSTGTSFGDNLIQLEYIPLEALTSEPAYSIAGSNLYLSPTIGRPATVFIRALQTFTLPTNDATDSGLPDVVIPAIQHTAASILALSYLDDPNQASVQQNLAGRLLDKLKTQYGTSRAKAFNISGQRAVAGWGSGGVSGVSNAVQYAPLDSPQLSGNPTAPTPPTTDNDTSIATTAFVQAQRPNAPYLFVRPGGISVPHATWTTLISTNVISDTTGSYNTSTGEFTAPNTGVYSIGFTANFISAFSTCVIRALVNGGVSVYELNAVFATAFTTTGTVVIPLTAGQKLTFQVNHSNGTSSANTTGSSSYITVFRVLA